MWAVSTRVRVEIQSCSWNWGKRLLQRLVQKQEDNVQMEPKNIGVRVLAESTGANGIQWQPFVNVIMNPGSHKRQGMWCRVVWPICACIPNCTASHFRSVVFCSDRLENFLSHREILAQLSDSEILRTRLCGVNYFDVWIRQLVQDTSTTSNLRHPIIRHFLSAKLVVSCCVVGARGNAHTLYITLSYLRDNFCLQTECFVFIWHSKRLVAWIKSRTIVKNKCVCVCVCIYIYIYIYIYLYLYVVKLI